MACSRPTSIWLPLYFLTPISLIPISYIHDRIITCIRDARTFPDIRCRCKLMQVWQQIVTVVYIRTRVFLRSLPPSPPSSRIKPSDLPCSSAGIVYIPLTVASCLHPFSLYFLLILPILTRKFYTILYSLFPFPSLPLYPSDTRHSRSFYSTVYSSQSVLSNYTLCVDSCLLKTGLSRQRYPTTWLILVMSRIYICTCIDMRTVLPDCSPGYDMIRLAGPWQDRSTLMAGERLIEHTSSTAHNQFTFYHKITVLYSKSFCVEKLRDCIQVDFAQLLKPVFEHLCNLSQ